MMAVKDLVHEVNNFLFNNMGVNDRIISACLNRRVDPLKTAFFQPYQSKSDTFFRAASVITAPIAITAITIELAAWTVYHGFKILADLVMLRPSDALQDLLKAGLGVLLTIAAAALAITSPVINTVDLIGSGITTLLQDSDDEEDAPASELTI